MTTPVTTTTTTTITIRVLVVKEVAQATVTGIVKPKMCKKMCVNVPVYKPRIPSVLKAGSCLTLSARQPQRGVRGILKSQSECSWPS